MLGGLCRGLWTYTPGYVFSTSLDIPSQNHFHRVLACQGRGGQLTILVRLSIEGRVSIGEGLWSWGASWEASWGAGGGGLGGGAPGGPLLRACGGLGRGW